jgi:hypothetical protein
VKMYFDEFKLQNLLAGTPKALHDRAIDDMEQHLVGLGVRVTGDGDGFVVLDISRAPFEHVYAFLADYAACVDVQRNDVEAILGRTVDALVLVRAFDLYGAMVKAKLSSLTPGEIYDACYQLSAQFQAEGNQIEVTELTGAIEAQAESDLENAGLLPQTRGVLEPKSEPERPLRYNWGTDPEPPNFLDPFGGGGVAGF